MSLSIRDPFSFEFLGLQAKDIVSENELEESLISNLQSFILELGNGFCFEARQKRIIIDDRYYFADLVFYNRLLHCNVIIELKNDEFKHEYIGQLNAYVSYYKENEMRDGDNPPVGILLCTRKGEKMVYLRGFGTFATKERAAKTARNISKGTAVEIPAHKVPTFKPSPEFKEKVRLKK